MVNVRRIAFGAASVTIVAVIGRNSKAADGFSNVSGSPGSSVGIIGRFIGRIGNVIQSIGNFYRVRLSRSVGRLDSETRSVSSFIGSIGNFTGNTGTRRPVSVGLEHMK